MSASSSLPGEPPALQPWQEPWLRGLLRCPVDRAELTDATAPDGAVELACADPGHRVAYPVRDGVPALLADDARPLAPAATGGAGR